MKDKINNKMIKINIKMYIIIIITQIKTFKTVKLAKLINNKIFLNVHQE